MPELIKNVANVIEMVYNKKRRAARVVFGQPCMMKAAARAAQLINLMLCRRSVFRLAERSLSSGSLGTVTF